MACGFSGKGTEWDCRVLKLGYAWLPFQISLMINLPLPLQISLSIVLCFQSNYMFPCRSTVNFFQ